MSQIFIGSNEKSTIAVLTKILRTEGYKVTSETDELKAAQLLQKPSFDLVILATGGVWDKDMALLAKLRSDNPDLAVIAVADSNNPDLLQKIEQLKPYAIQAKPLKVDKLLASIQSAIDFGVQGPDKQVNLNIQLETCYQFDDIVAESPVMKSVCEMISRVVATDVTILIMGERGAGKDLLARTIHANSRRNSKPLVTVDCASQSIAVDLFGSSAKPGAIERANGATLFLSDIEKLMLPMQQALANVLQEKKFKGADGRQMVMDVRVVVTGSLELDTMVQEGRFNNDLYRLIRIILVKVPPLRERKEDIMPSLRRILQKKVQNGILPNLDPDLVEYFENYPWPGNLDEMDRVLEQMVKNSPPDRISISALPANVGGTR